MVHLAYGFCTVDPRRFKPDPECSTDAEREAHRQDCEALERGEELPTRVPTYVSAMGVATSYGLGTYEWDCEGDPMCPECGTGPEEGV